MDVLVIYLGARFPITSQKETGFLEYHSLVGRSQMESKGNWKYPTEKQKSRKYYFILPARNTIVKGKGTLKFLHLCQVQLML